MKCALVTMLNDNFFRVFEAFITSLLKNNPWFNYPIVILDDHCSKDIKNKCLRYYKNIVFRPIQYDNYIGTDFSGTAQRLQCTFYKLDAFSIIEYDRLVFIDLDVLILGDIKDLFTKYREPFCGCPAFALNKDRFRRDINSGVFVINNIDREGTYRRLVNRAKNQKISMPDQKIINIYFGEETFLMDKKYNVEKRMLKSKKHPIDPVILHLVGSKDFIFGGEGEDGYRSVELLWEEWYTKSKKLSGEIRDILLKDYEDRR
jgi:lipopolysaccharide biosynthesis glycosyltransferase